jgi:hypothetical protein
VGLGRPPEVDLPVVVTEAPAQIRLRPLVHDDAIPDRLQ